MKRKQHKALYKSNR